MTNPSTPPSQFSAYPIKATVTIVQGSCYVKCSTDLTRELEPGMTVRIGAPDGQDWILSDCLPPHIIKEIEAKRVREEEEKREVEEYTGDQGIFEQFG